MSADRDVRYNNTAGKSICRPIRVHNFGRQQKNIRLITLQTADCDVLVVDYWSQQKLRRKKVKAVGAGVVRYYGTDEDGDGDSNETSKVLVCLELSLQQAARCTLHISRYPGTKVIRTYAYVTHYS